MSGASLELSDPILTLRGDAYAAEQFVEARIVAERVPDGLALVERAAGVLRARFYPAAPRLSPPVSGARASPRIGRAPFTDYARLL